MIVILCFYCNLMTPLSIQQKNSYYPFALHGFLEALRNVVCWCTILTSSTLYKGGLGRGTEKRTRHLVVQLCKYLSKVIITFCWKMKLITQHYLVLSPQWGEKTHTKQFEQRLSTKRLRHCLLTNSSMYGDICEH